MNKWFVIDRSVARPFGHSPVTIACRPKPKEINCQIVKDQPEHRRCRQKFRSPKTTRFPESVNRQANLAENPPQARSRPAGMPAASC